MTSQHSAEQVPVETAEVQVVERNGVFTAVLRRLSGFWPFSLMIRAYRGVWWMLGFPAQTEALRTEAASPSGRQSLAGRKRLRRATRLLLAVLPRRLQAALGYPVSATIGCSLSPDVRVSPTKPCGKGSKRKQDDLDDEEDQEQPTWVEALSQELTDEGSEDDPDYKPSFVETGSEEYCSHNNTESDIEVSEKGVVIIEDVKVDVLPAASN